MNILVLFGILACLVTLGNGLQCHQCQTLEYKTCRDPYSTDNMDDCDEGFFCTKFKTIVKIRDSGYINGWERHSQVVTRSCEAKRGNKEGCIAWQNNGGITIKCWCAEEGCNSGPVVRYRAVTIILSCLASLLSFVIIRQHRLV